MLERDQETRRVTGYLSLYTVNRCYGGPEEGGWWYDAYVWTRVSFPFRAKQDFIYVNINDEDEDPEPVMAWRAYGDLEPEDFQSKVRLESMRSYLTELYDVKETKRRYSVLGGDDTKFVFELEPGSLEDQPRPRYQ